MAEIIAFPIQEMPKINVKELEVLFAEMGSSNALRVFERVLFEISDKLCMLELYLHDGDYDQAIGAAKSLKNLCPQIGLDCLARVCASFVQEFEADNIRALPVLCNRMICLGEASLFQLSNLPKVLSDQ
ncbi:MAG: hypothetical protein COB84_09475 [Rhodobacteraceae bacterium]|nr:MAG: hypothetical protein COB84_09475 [Paracoccaceae bacterium]